MRIIKPSFLIFFLAYFLFFNSIKLNAQQNISLQKYYKTQYLKFSRNNSFETFYPVNSSNFNLQDSLKDTTTFYYDFHVWFFTKNWLEIKENKAKLEINPLVDFSFGKGSSIADSLPLYRNSRGISVSGELTEKISFSFILSENQSRFMNYQNLYFFDRGEFYDLDTVYGKVNAVIPGAARTKPFKTNGFDYAYSVGYFAYQVNKKLRIEAGNNMQFIGSGYRSLLLSDNSIYAPNLRFNWQINPKLSYQILYRKHKNLYRKPKTLAVESAYETKFFSVNYLTYKMKSNLSLSLFTSGNQLLTDSITKYKHQFNMLLPLPFYNTDFIFKNDIINGLSGLNIDYALSSSIRFYSQIAMDDFNKKLLFAYQFGGYYFDAFRLKNLNFQIEFNYIPNNFYSNENDKLTYSQYNLALAHPKGNNFSEIFFNINYEFKRLFFSNSLNYYKTQGGILTKQIEANSIFTTNKSDFEKGIVVINTLEIAYRINKKYNPTIYFQYSTRKSNFQQTKFSDNHFLVGLRVNLLNQYLDF